VSNERRAGPRVPVPQGTVVRVKFKDRKQFETMWVKDLSNGGIFLRTSSAAPVFSRMTVVLELPGGEGQQVELSGEVVRVVTPADAAAGMAPGMGVQFTDLTPEKRRLLESYLGAAAPGGDELDLEAPPPSTSAKATPAPPRAAPFAPTLTSAGTPAVPRGAAPAPRAPAAPAAPPASPRPAPPPSPGRRITGPPTPVTGLEEMNEALRRVIWFTADVHALAACDYYDLLGLPPSAPAARVAEACSVLRTLLDPKIVSMDLGMRVAERMQQVGELLADMEATLVDPTKRALYDKQRRR
jgi:uncharacterized protein (TIGR02266 family)